MNRFLKIPLLAATLALPMLLSSCVVDGYAYREPYGGRYYNDDYYSYPVSYGRSYYGGGYPYSSYYGGYPYGYYGGGALIGGSYYRNRYRYYNNDYHRHDHHDGGHRRHYSSSGRSGSTYANRQVRHGDHYHSSQLKKSQHQAMIRRGDSTPSSRTVSSRSSGSSTSKGKSGSSSHRHR
jgi:hypothetical protein